MSRQLLVTAVFATAGVIFVMLLFIPAPYGRHARRGWGPRMNTRLGWLLMESPASFGFAAFFWLGAHHDGLVPWLLFLLWEAHYVHRDLIYPWTLRLRPGDATPVLVTAMGFVFNLVNAYLNGSWVGGSGYGAAWLSDPRFILGGALFIAGYTINRHADLVLRRLRRSKPDGYSIPHGGLYRWISCPNYFGELVQWCGWAVATWSLAGLAFAVFTCANLAPRAVAHHRWYRTTFSDYPSGRRALVPFLL